MPRNGERGGPARECNPTAGAAIAHLDEQAQREPGSVLGRPLTAKERQAIRAHIDLEARRSVREAGGFCAEPRCWRKLSSAEKFCYWHREAKAS